MATNKHALIRFKVLDRCFSNPGKKYFISDLIDECNKALMTVDPDSNGISRRQIFDDIAFMESEEGWCIDLQRRRDGKKVYYRYSDTSFSINNMPLNEVEVNQLQSAIDILSQFKGMPQFEWVHEMEPKLRAGASSTRRKVIEFDSNQYLKGIEHLSSLYNAILYKKVLRITYLPFEDDLPFVWVIHPYYLKQYNNRWFLFGLNPENEKFDWNLALDRIQTIEEMQLKYRKNSEIDWEEYFEDIIGVTKPTDKSLEKVILHFFGKTGKYIETKPLHGSQKARRMDLNTLEVTLELIINYELERLILSYADSVKVICPDSLASTVRERILASLDNY